jgi:hypothetical protein
LAQGRAPMTDLFGGPLRGHWVLPGSPAEFGKLIADETEKWGQSGPGGQYQAGVISDGFILPEKWHRASGSGGAFLLRLTVARDDMNSFARRANWPHRHGTSAKAISLAPSGKSPPLVSAGPRFQRGALRDRHERWCGLRWTRRRTRRMQLDADGEVVWSRCPDAGIKLAAKAASDGGKQAGHRGEHEGNR